MPTAAPILKKSTWEDQFRPPRAEALLTGLGLAGGPLRGVRNRLLSLPGVRETVAWRGVLHWTLCFDLPQGQRIFLVPCPAKPQMCVPLPESLLTQPALAACKGLREQVELAPLVGDVRWLTTPLTSEAVASELLRCAGVAIPEPMPHAHAASRTAGRSADRENSRKNNQVGGASRPGTATSPRPRRSR